MNISQFKNIIWNYTRKINDNVNNLFNPICERYGLTMLQVRILMELYKYESSTIGSLAESILVTGTNMSVMCKKMENMGLLKRIRAQEDERVVKVYLTDKGNEIVSEIDRTFDVKISQNIADNPEKTLDEIVKGIQKLNELLQKISSHKE